MAESINVRSLRIPEGEVYYDRKRIQRKLGYPTPAEYELGFEKEMALTA